MADTVLDRFLRYVVIDTQSDPGSESQPSTEKQKNLGRVLVEDLLAIGLSDAHLDEHGYVYATLPPNTDKAVPVICWCSHMDTAPDFTGTNVLGNTTRGGKPRSFSRPGSYLPFPFVSFTLKRHPQWSKALHPTTSAPPPPP